MLGILGATVDSRAVALGRTAAVGCIAIWAGVPLIAEWDAFGCGGSVGNSWCDGATILWSYIWCFGTMALH